jgi:dynein heavy chain 1
MLISSTELDKWIEGILLYHLTDIIQVWCAEFDHIDDGDTRRDPLPLRDMTC